MNTSRNTAPSCRFSRAVGRGFLAVLITASLVACSGGEDPPASRTATAGPGVTVIETPLAMPGLDRTRTIRVYLPPDYSTSDRRYPVLYMHDGQNLFDDATSYAGEWGVDEALDRLAETQGFELIVVGIDNGQALRAREMLPWTDTGLEGLDGSDAAAYLAFITDTVKPWADARYRTLPGRQHTGIMGSSFGGIASHYAIQARPDVFSRAGIFSPSYWVSDKAFSDAWTKGLSPDIRLALQVGEREGDDMVPDFERMAARLREAGLGPDRLWVRLSPGGKHHESTWREAFPEAVRFLFTMPEAATAP